MRKLRTYRSCLSCRLSKTKCDGNRPKCSRCAAKLAQCVYNGGPASRWTRNLDKPKRMSMEAEEEAQEQEGNATERYETTVTEVAQTAPVLSDGDDSEEASLECSDQVHDKPPILSDARSMAVPASSPSLRDSDSKVALLASHPLACEVQEDHGASPLLQAIGNGWAKRAEYLMLANFALMISGLAVRMAHALKINIEYDADILCTQVDTAAPSVVSRESRRRLMWACYVLDAWAGSGVDQLTLLRENDIKIQLPSNERNFGLRIPSVTETLGVGHVLQFLPPAVVPRRPTANMGIMAYYIRVVALWKRIVRYVNHFHAASPPLWEPDSLFAALEADLHLWRQELPDFVDYTAETIYARLDSNQLGALVLMLSDNMDKTITFKNGQTAILRTPSDWTSWIDSIKAVAIHYEIWDQIKPEGPIEPLRERPIPPICPEARDYPGLAAFPEPATAAHLTAAGLRTYRLDVEAYNALTTKYKTEMDIAGTISKGAPTDEEPKQLGDMASKIRRSKSYAEKNGVAEVSSLNPIIKDFTAAVTKVAENWTSNFLDHGRDDPRMTRKEMMRKIRVQMTNKYPNRIQIRSNTRQSASFFTMDDTPIDEDGIANTIVGSKRDASNVPDSAPSVKRSKQSRVKQNVQLGAHPPTVESRKLLVQFSATFVTVAVKSLMMGLSDETSATPFFSAYDAASSYLASHISQLFGFLIGWSAF
ncbi:hypothetical protein E4U33_003777 [Claviceps sp. LM78 group G4]|nr:hypothetical protein E4U33_003777 [Claviceps sp. LM78 group G4]